MAALSSVVLLAGVAACGTEADAATTTSSSSTAVAGAADTTVGAASSSGSTYTDGTYTATGSYNSPGGTESVTVSVTLAADVVTAVSVTPEADNPTSSQFQNQFASGIASAVVGKDISDLSVSKVSGSSLTSEGFNAALVSIRSEAAGS
ncbi:hypothetical protein D1871_10845 [Nakamurella silvestris]|nr:hypothetical protein D1871_10845 [Nakamurella silvestris]